MVFSNLISANADGHFEYFFQLVASNRACCRSSLASIRVGNRVTRIGDQAFSGCSSLGILAIPGSVTLIGDEAFAGCSGLASIDVGGGVTRIGDRGFSACSSLSTLTIPNSVTSLGSYAFEDCTGLTNLTIGTGVTNISGGAFSGCTGLSDVVIPNGVTAIWDLAFNNCTGLTNIVIPDSVTLLGSGAFQACTGLISVTIPGSVSQWDDRWVRQMGGGAIHAGPGVFASCTNLKAATMLDGVSHIGGGAFWGCTSLTSLTIPNSVTNVGRYAFWSCTSLTRITIPSSVVGIEGCAFAACTNLTSLCFEGNAPSDDNGLCLGDTSTPVYYLPGTTGWGPHYGGVPTALWVRPNPAILDFGERFGPSTNGFGFVISWATTDAPVVVEASADLNASSWTSIWTNRLTNGWVHFTDPDWRSQRAMSYRVRSDSGFIRPGQQVDGARFAWIPKGTFVMGSPSGERGRWDSEGPQTSVTISKGYWLGRYEVTQREYIAVMGMNPSFFQPPQFSEDLDRPVEQVSWIDAAAYCRALTEREGTTGALPIGYAYRLPTEAEWEYACRAGSTTRFSFGAAMDCDDGCAPCWLLDSYMWWCGNSVGLLHAVGGRLPNSWGLNDMHGSVMEWCQDFWGEYPGGMVTDPQGPTAGSYRVVRGGGWGEVSRNCRSASRGYGDSDGSFYHVGFRVLLAPRQ